MAPGHKRSVRASQPAARAGLGTHFTSPLKQHDARKKRVVQGLGRAQRATAAHQDLEALLRRAPVPGAPGAAPDVPVAGSTGPDATMADWVDLDPPALPSSPSLPRDPTGGSAQRLNDAWNHLLPRLEAPWLQYYESIRKIWNYYADL
ncbi:hypothetical protein B0H15DRAFT_799980 [Mycena belliarum]|uniref:Uncharacterized protein n=1 Tax=Mycena belliarum TaxID=1033014 RepID=A0AAD6U5G7_9AGAR|nr:hypothetical protein B0H15DRAFT_799980 [Mycena belliae]